MTNTEECHGSFLVTSLARNELRLFLLGCACPCWPVPVFVTLCLSVLDCACCICYAVPVCVGLCLSLLRCACLCWPVPAVFVTLCLSLLRCACLCYAVRVRVELCLSLSLLGCVCLCYAVSNSFVVLALLCACAVRKQNIDPDSLYERCLYYAICTTKYFYEVYVYTFTEF